VIHIVANHLRLPRNSSVVLYYNSYRLSPHWALGDIEADQETPIYVRVRQSDSGAAADASRPMSPRGSPSAIPPEFLRLLSRLGLDGQYTEPLMLQALDRTRGDDNAAITLLMDGAVRMPPVSAPSPPESRRKEDPLDTLLGAFPIDPAIVRDVYEHSGRNFENARDILRQMCS
jgi:hypothetical protein